MSREAAFAILAVSLAGLGGCRGAAETAGEVPPFEVLEQPAPAEAVERAEHAARALGGALLARLSDELESGGPEAALVVCSQVAPRIICPCNVGSQQDCGHQDDSSRKGHVRSSTDVGHPEARESGSESENGTRTLRTCTPRPNGCC